MERIFVDIEDARTIGARARKIRHRRGLSLDVVAGLAGIKKQYLSMLDQRNTYRGSEDFTPTLLKQAIIMNGDQTTTHHMQ